MTVTDPRYAVIAAWEIAAQRLKEAKAAEAVLRKQVLELCYPQHVVGAELEGTHNVPLENGFRLKGTFGVTYAVDKDVLPSVMLELSQGSEAAQHAADLLFRYKPELNVTPYKLLMPSIKAIVDKAVTTKASAPQFEIVESKRK